MNHDAERIYEGIKLQICNLDLEVDFEMLYKELSTYGVLLNAEIIEGSRYSPVKSATVTYYSPGEAQQAIRHLNGKKLLKNTLYVGIARDRQRRVRSRSYQNITGSIGTMNLGSSWNGRPKSDYKNCPLDSSLPSFSAPELTNDTPVKSAGDSLIEFKHLIATRSSGIPSQLADNEKVEDNSNVKDIIS